MSITENCSTTTLHTHAVNMTDLSARISRAPPPSTDIAAFFSSARVQHGSPKADRLSRGLSALGHMSALAGSSNEHQQRTKGNGQDVRTPIPIPLAQRIQPEQPQRPFWALTESGNVLTAESTSTTCTSPSLLARLGPLPRPSLLPPSGPKNSGNPPVRPLGSPRHDGEWAEYARRRTAPSPPRTLSPPPRSTPAATPVTPLARSLSSGSSRPPTPPLSPALAETNYRPPSPDYPPPEDHQIVSLSVALPNKARPHERLPRVSCGESQEIDISPHSSDPATTDDRSASSRSPALKRKASGDLGSPRSASPSKKPALTGSTGGGPFAEGDTPRLAAAVDPVTDEVDISQAGSLAPLSPGYQSPDVSSGPQHTFLPLVDVAEQSGEPLSSLAITPDAPSSPAVTPLRVRLSTPESIQEMPSVILDDEPDVSMFLNPMPAIFVPVVEQHHPPQPPTPMEGSAPQKSSEIKPEPEEVSANGGTVMIPRSELPDNLWSDDVASRTAARLRVREELRTRCRSDGRGVDRVSWTVEGMSYRWRPLDQPADSSPKGESVGIAESAAAAVVAPGSREEALFLEAQAFLSSIRVRGGPHLDSEPVEASSLVAGSGDSSTAPSDPATRSKSSPSSPSFSPAIPADLSPRPSPPNATIENENRIFTIEIPLPPAFQTSRGRGGSEYRAWQNSQIDAAHMRNDRGAWTCWVRPKKIHDNVLPLMWKPPSTMTSPACPIPGAQLVKISPSQQTGVGDSKTNDTPPVTFEPSLSEHSKSAQVPKHASSSTTAGSSHSVSTPKHVDPNSAGSKSSGSAQVTSIPTTNSRTVPLPAKWADRTTSELKADPDSAQWFAAQRALIRAALSDQYGSVPVNLRSSRAHGQLIFRWSSDHPPRGRSSPLPAAPIENGSSATDSDIDGSPAQSACEFLDPPEGVSTSADITHRDDATRTASRESSKGKEPMRSGSIDTVQHLPKPTPPASELLVKQNRPECLEGPESSQVTTSVSTNSAISSVSAPASLAPTTSTQTTGTTSARIDELQRSMDAKLLALDNWFKILDSHPNRKTLLDKLIDKAQDDVLEIQQQIDLESARVVAVL